MDTPPSPPPNPPSLTKQEDEYLDTSEEELAQNQTRRESVHYATIAEFLASLKSVQEKAPCLEDYLGAVRYPVQESPGDGDPVKESRDQAKD
ncbi:uncharacterized protein LOC110178027 [Drosophila serrata]|uniref:uncharacterized protein LOC110178027 n=1 Tax=Drosophila serrata TaxID=7274 RepID=UPI000A1D202D|nr:uncharacterized protein LOC110178027 [Drosophila serrata]